jgi:hypothetical protein
MASPTLLSLPDAILLRLCDNHLSFDDVARLYATCGRMADLRRSSFSNTNHPAAGSLALRIEYFDGDDGTLTLLQSAPHLTGLKDLKITNSPDNDEETSFPKWLFTFLSKLPGQLESLTVLSWSPEAFRLPVLQHLQHLSLGLYYFYDSEHTTVLAEAVQAMHSLRSLGLSIEDDSMSSGIDFAGLDMLACQHLRSLALELVEPKFVRCAPETKLRVYVREDCNLQRWATMSHSLRFKNWGMETRGDASLIFAPPCHFLTSLQLELLFDGLGETEAPVQIGANMPCLKLLVLFATHLFMKLANGVQLETLELECQDVMCLGISDAQSLGQSLRLCTLDALGIACFELAAVMQAVSARGIQVVRKKRYDRSSRIEFSGMGCSSALGHRCTWPHCWRCKRRKCGTTHED